MSRIDILLATYNGAKFLPEQLASLAAQTHADWRLLVRDDGSKDGSLDVVRAWADTVDQPVIIIEDGRTGLGASLNFAALLEQSDAPYFACCDQDDVWLPEKLEVMLAALQSGKADEAANIRLAFCDLEVVNENLGQIAPSFWKLSNLCVQPASLSPHQLLLRNTVTGCAMLGNAALREAALPIPGDARMHDWWMALVASSFGQLLPVPRPLVQYRQHGANVIGAMNANPLALLDRFARGPRASIERAKRARDNSQRQARAFAHRFDLDATNEAGWANIVQRYGQLAERPIWERKWFLLKHGLGKGSVPYFLALLAVS